MKIDIKVEFDTDNERDLEKIEEVMYHLQQVKDILQKLDKNLNNNTNRKQKTTKWK